MLAVAAASIEQDTFANMFSTHSSQVPHRDRKYSLEFVLSVIKGAIHLRRYSGALYVLANKTNLEFFQ